MVPAKPYVYLRKSRVFRDRVPISPEMQLAECRDMLRRNGHNPDDIVVLTDLNKSGRKGRAGRPGFDQLLTAVELGTVTVIASYSLSRLSRKMADVVALAEQCAAAKVPILLARDISPDPTTASGKLMLSLVGAMAVFEADVASERSADTAAARRARGDKLGPHFYGEKAGESLEAVRQAFLDAGSMNGAAKLLKLSGLLTRNGNPVWSATAVRDILLRHCPEIVPPAVTRGVKAAAPFKFYRLVVCHCGRTMTGSRDMARNGYTRYQCMGGRADPDHGRTGVAERSLLPAIEAELTLFRLPMDAVAESEIAEARITELKARKARVVEAKLDGLMDRDEAKTETARINDELGRLEMTGRIVEVRADIPLDGDPKLVNEALRRLFERIELDAEMQVQNVHWREPSFRVQPQQPTLRVVTEAG